MSSYSQELAQNKIIQSLNKFKKMNISKKYVKLTIRNTTDSADIKYIPINKNNRNNNINN